MSKAILVIAVVLTLAGFTCQEAQATQMPIVGLLNISGSGPSPSALSASSSFSDVAVDEGTNGSFSIIQIGAPVAIASPSMFLGSSTAVSNLWSVGGFTLELNFGKVISDPHQITMSGSATIFAPGAAPVSGAQWKYTSLIGGSFTFHLTSSGLVPDSGMTIVLLGVGWLRLQVADQDSQSPNFSRCSLIARSNSLD